MWFSKTSYCFWRANHKKKVAQMKSTCCATRYHFFLYIYITIFGVGCRAQNKQNFWTDRLIDRRVTEKAKTKWDKKKTWVREENCYSRFAVQTNCTELYSPHTRSVHSFDGCCINPHAIKWWTTSFVVSHLWAFNVMTRNTLSLSIAFVSMAILVIMQIHAMQIHA